MWDVFSWKKSSKSAGELGAGSPQGLHAILQQLTNKTVLLRINDNRSTLLSVQQLGDTIKVSVHRMFLEAPEEVLKALGKYVSGRSRRPGVVLQTFMDARFAELDYSHRVHDERLVSLGTHFDLVPLFSELNAQYFEGTLDLNLTWYGEWVPRRRARVTFGLYSHPLKLIKVHRILDRPVVPDYFVRYVLFHEMLHSVVLPVTDSLGRTRVHHAEFKRREKAFHDYQRATQWLKVNRKKMFEGKL